MDVLRAGSLSNVPPDEDGLIHAFLIPEEQLESVETDEERSWGMKMASLLAAYNANRKMKE